MAVLFLVLKYAKYDTQVAVTQTFSNLVEFVKFMRIHWTECFLIVILTKLSTEKSSSHTGCGENVRMCTQYGAQGHVKIKIPSSLLWIIFWVGPDTRWSDPQALLKHFHTVLSPAMVDISVQGLILTVVGDGIYQSAACLISYLVKTLNRLMQPN